MTNYSNIILWVLSFNCILLLQGCVDSHTNSETINYFIDTTSIPADTINFKNTNLAYVNGKYLLNSKPYSGVVYEVLKGYGVQTYSSVLKGELHGVYRSYYSNGKLNEIRSYKNNLSVGKQYGYYEETGTLKFEYNYYNEKKEGVQKSWFPDGSLAYVYNYKDDKQDELQQAWRINGSLYRNFEVINGKRYGLQKSVSCKELIDEKIKQVAKPF